MKSSKSDLGLTYDGQRVFRVKFQFGNISTQMTASRRRKLLSLCASVVLKLRSRNFASDWLLHLAISMEI
jgi:hypothetical protein